MRHTMEDEAAAAYAAAPAADEYQAAEKAI